MRGTQANHPQNPLDFRGTFTGWCVLYTLHTPPRAIGELAKEAEVRKLLLSHLSPATEEMHDAVLKSIRENYTGPVTLAEDGMHVQP